MLAGGPAVPPLTVSLALELAPRQRSASVEQIAAASTTGSGF
jgi:hypothetical protein